MGSLKKPLSLTTTIRIEKWRTLIIWCVFVVGIFFFVSRQSLTSEPTRTTGQIDIDQFIVKTTEGREFQLLGFERPEIESNTDEQLSRGALRKWLEQYVEGKTLILTVHVVKHDDPQGGSRKAVLAYLPDGTLLNEMLIEKGLVTVNHKTRHVLDQWFERLAHRAD